MSSVSFQNQSANIQDADLQAFIQDLQAQINNEFGQAWGVCATADDGGTGWPIYLVDSPPPQDGILGYHDLDQNYNPYAIIFVQYALDNGIGWTTVADHEVLEMLADPYIDSSIFVDTSGGVGTSGVLVFQEICDPCEGQSYSGAVNGTALSDFVFPTFYVLGYPGQVDTLGQVAGPFLVAPGGYLSYDEVILAGGWQAIFGAKEVKAKMAAMAKPGPGQEQQSKAKSARRAVQYLPAQQMAETENARLKRLLVERDLELASVKQQLARSGGGPVGDGKSGARGNGAGHAPQRLPVSSTLPKES